MRPLEPRSRLPQGFERHPLRPVLCQRVRRRAHDHQIVFPPWHHANFRFAAGAFDQTHVDFQPRHRSRDFAGVADPHIDARGRPCIQIAGHQRRQEIVARPNSFPVRTTWTTS